MALDIDFLGQKWLSKEVLNKRHLDCERSAALLLLGR